MLLVLPAVLIASRSFTPEEQQGPDQVRRLYTLHLQALEADLQQFAADLNQVDTLRWREDFKACRKAYKYVEYLVAYHYPLVAQRINGPALPEVEVADFHETGEPTGFQVLEEDLYGTDVLRRVPAMQKEIKHLLSYNRIVSGQTGRLAFTESLLYDALKLNLYTLAAKGISGFDSPVALLSLHEAAVTLDALQETLTALGHSDAIIKGLLDKGRGMLLDTTSDFESFDRAVFFQTVFNPLLQALHRQQLQLQIAFYPASRAVKTKAESFFAPGAFDPYFFAPEGTEPATAVLVSLGAMLFADNTMSRGGRSCKSCHDPARAFTDGLVVNSSLQRDEGLMRNTPSLNYAALQPALFYDVRADYLEQQAHDVLFNKAEMDGALEQAIAGFNKNSSKRKAFTKAFPGSDTPVSQQHIITALAAYQRSLPRFNAAFDRYMQGDMQAMNAQQVKGFNLFMGKAKCGTCHFMPLFNGANPPFYDKIDSEILGVPADTQKLKPAIDPDLGAYYHFKNKVKKYAFKTPTVRNAARTAPYMHNGVYSSLEQVIDFYNRGGGAGLGIELPGQTLPTDPLQLSTAEQQALIAFIHALSDQ